MNLRSSLFLALCLCACSTTDKPISDGPAPPNELTPEEYGAGWRLLFDGETLEGWRSFKRATPDGWAALDGAIKRVGGGGDLISERQYLNFVLELEWKIAPGGNSGIFYGVDEKHDHVWQTGPEMQVLDNAGHHDGKNVLTSAGADYALHAPAADVTHPVGEWNHIRLEVNGPRVRHSMNGALLLQFDRWTDEWKEEVANSKFASMPDYGMNDAGHIALQDHGDEVWYRNIKIREL